MELDENDQFGTTMISPVANLSNSHSNEESVVESNQEDQVGLDIFIEEQ